MWEGRHTDPGDVVSMVVANTITGAATLFRRELLELAVPFPDSPGFQFHDHWLGLLALAAGDVAYVDRPLYDYVQHAGAVFGDVTLGAGRRTRRPWRPAAAADYFYGFAARRVQVETALLRTAGRIAPARRSALERFLRAEDSPLAWAALAARPLRALRGHDETLGSEAGLARGLAWRRVLSAVPAAAHVLGEAAVPPPDAYDQPRLRRWRSAVARG
jgi:hypothetical protein